MRAPAELIERTCNLGAAGAVFDTTERYRYSLWRVWDGTLPRLLWIMLNPSTADETKNDPTIRRCIDFAGCWGYGSIEVVNLFALRATKPSDLRQDPAAIGSENDVHILRAAARADRAVAAWGTHGAYLHRDRDVARLLAGIEFVCLGVTRGGHPRHPLYISAQASLVSWTATEEAAS